MTVKTPATIDDLYKIPGKAEIVDWNGYRTETATAPAEPRDLVPRRPGARKQ